MADRATDPLTVDSVDKRGRAINDNGERHLALEVRSRKLGFAVFQGSDLLDWGARRYAAGAVGAAGAFEKLRSLLKLYAPHIVIARQTRRVHDESSEIAARRLYKIRMELRSRSIRLVVVNRRDVRRFFAQYGCRAKHDIASLIANRFPELKWRLPRRRKPWDSEAHAAAVFDAIGTAIAFIRVPPFAGRG
jgi:hypothetical protein